MSPETAQPVGRAPTAVAGPGWTNLARELVFPLLTVVAIVGYADVRIPVGLSGHRGLIWLTLLVAVVLTTRRRATVLAVGAAATIATYATHISTVAPGSDRYLAAAILLYVVTAAPVARRRHWLVALAAAPIHLVALADMSVGLLGRGHLSAIVSTGITEKALSHLAFGLAAGLFGWAIASALTRVHRTR